MQLTYLTKLGIFSLGLFLVKLLILPFVHEIDADGVTRIYLALQFAHNPQVINSGNWPPIFFYIMGVALRLFNYPHSTPIVVNILFSVLLIFPLFSLLKREFSDKISFLLCVFFSFSPIVVRMSMLAMSEIPYLFFVIASISALAKGYFEKKTLWVLLAGLLMGIAGGIRYESWILGTMVMLLLFYYKLKKETLYFGLPFILIPIYWIISSYHFTNEALHSFTWAIHLPKENSIQSMDSLLRRIWWYPLSLVFAFGPIAFFFFIKEVKNVKSNKISYSLFLLFVAFFSIWLVNSLRGSLLLQHRFTVTLFLLSFPFIGYYFKRNGQKIVQKTVLFSLTSFLLAFVYSSKGARPIPRLLTKDAQKVSSLIGDNITAKSGFICDFWNWETTYYLPFSIGLKENNIVIIESNDDSKYALEKIDKLIESSPSGVLLVNKTNTLFKILRKEGINYRCTIQKKELILIHFYENESIICFKYKTFDSNQSSAIRT